MSDKAGEASPLRFSIVGRFETKVWTKLPGERLRRQLAQQGITEEVEEKALPREPGAVLLLRADAVLDGPVLAGLVAAPNVLLSASDPAERAALAIHAPAGLASAAAAVLRAGTAQWAPEPLYRADPEALCSAYWKGLRKKEIPYALRLTPDNRQAVEWRMFMGTYKGATDFVTKWLWPRPAFYVTKICAATGLTPNFVTFLSLLLVLGALYGFWIGLWLPALAAGWLMTFLDTVDGKLARITLTSSKFGNAFDHGIDLVHPPFWYVAWAVGLQASAHPLSDSLLWWSLGTILAGYILQRVLEGLSILFFDIEIHIWRPIDSAFRQITARRNPNLALLTLFTLAGRPDWGFLAVAIWTGVCLLLHGLQLLQARIAWRRDGALKSWMAQG